MDKNYHSRNQMFCWILNQSSSLPNHVNLGGFPEVNLLSQNLFLILDPRNQTIGTSLEAMFKATIDFQLGRVKTAQPLLEQLDQCDPENHMEHSRVLQNLLIPDGRFYIYIITSHLEKTLNVLIL